MGPLFTYSVITLLLASIIGCKGVSKYTIDDHPITETDSGLYGIWKLVEDTSNANFFLVQSPYGLFHLQIGGAIWTVRQKEHFLMKVTLRIHCLLNGFFIRMTPIIIKRIMSLLKGRIITATLLILTRAEKSKVPTMAGFLFQNKKSDIPQYWSFEQCFGWLFFRQVH